MEGQYCTYMQLYQTNTYILLSENKSCKNNYLQIVDDVLTNTIADGIDDCITDAIWHALTPTVDTTDTCTDSSADIMIDDGFGNDNE